MARIAEYEFGRVTIDGERHTRDVIVLPERVVGDWWRRDGHSLVIEDLDEVLDELPARLVVGCGAHGRLRPDPGVAEALARRGVERHCRPPRRCAATASSRPRARPRSPQRSTSPAEPSSALPRVRPDRTRVGAAQRCSGLGKSNRQPASHSERWFPCAGIPPASLSMRATWSRFQVMKVVLRLVKSFSGPPDPSSR